MSKAVFRDLGNVMTTSKKIRWSFIYSLAIGLLSLVPVSPATADIVLYENYGNGFTSFWPDSTSWNTWGDLLILDDSPNVITQLEFHMFSFGAAESNLAFFLYENNNDTVGNLLWSAELSGATAQQSGRHDFLFDGLSINAPQELFVGIAVENYNILLDGFHFGPVWGQFPSTGTSDGRSAILYGGEGTKGYAPGTPLEVDLDNSFSENNMQLTIMGRAIPEPTSLFLVGASCFGVFLRSRNRQL